MQKKRQLGSITTRANGRHYPQLTVRDPDGAARRISLGGFASRAEAERSLARAVVDLERGAFAPPSRRTLGAYLFEDWLPSIARDIRPTTYANYRALARAYVGPWQIARKKLSDLSELELKRFYATLAERGGRGGRPLSPKTVLHVHTMLRRALEDAVRSNLIPRNPAPKRRPRVERTEQAWLRASEMADLLAFVRFREPDLYPAFRLAALAGLRRGELAGLRWCDLDDDQSTLTIRRSRTIAGGRVVEGATKTSGSSSVIRIDPDTMSSLARLRERRSAVIEQGPPLTEHVFVMPSGEPVHPERFGDALRRAITAMNVDRAEPLPSISLHSLRHSYGSALVASGEHIRVVQAAMRHSSIRVTADTYVHLAPEAVGDANRRLAARVVAG